MRRQSSTDFYSTKLRLQTNGSAHRVQHARRAMWKLTLSDRLPCVRGACCSFAARHTRACVNKHTHTHIYIYVCMQFYHVGVQQQKKHPVFLTYRIARAIHTIYVVVVESKSQHSTVVVCRHSVVQYIYTIHVYMCTPPCMHTHSSVMCGGSSDSLCLRDCLCVCGFRTYSASAQRLDSPSEDFGSSWSGSGQPTGRRRYVHLVCHACTPVGVSPPP